MKQILIPTIVSIIFIACQKEDTTSSTAVDHTKIYEMNVETTKAYMNAFATADSVSLFSDKYVSDQLSVSLAEFGQDSLSKNAMMEYWRTFWKVCRDIEFTDAKYYPELDSLHRPNGNVRLCGTWVGTGIATEKTGKLKWHSLVYFNDEGKIIRQSEWANMNDIIKVLQ